MTTRVEKVAEEIAALYVEHGSVTEIEGRGIAEDTYRRALEDAADKMKRKADCARKSIYPWTVSSAAIYEDAELSLRALADEEVGP